MKDIYAILTGIGIEVPEDKKATLDKEWKENYRTIVEYEKATAKRDEYKTSLDTVQEQLKAFDGVNLEEYKNQIDTLTKDLEAEKAARIADEAKHRLESTVETFMGGKQFKNPLVEETVRSKLMAELDKDTAKGKSIEDLFKVIVSDKEGNLMPDILVDPEQQAAEGNKVVITLPMGSNKNQGGITKESFRKMDLDARMALKSKSPELYKSLTQ